MEQEALDKFINSILDEKKLPGMSVDVRAQLVRDLGQRLLDQINRAVIDALPEEIVNKIDEALDNPEAANEHIQQLIVESDVDVKRIGAETMLRFRDLYLGLEGK